MKTKMTALAVILMAAATLAPVSANAKNWIEKVDMVTEGIDLASVDVAANSNGYKSFKTGKHRFSLRVYAKATSGERIVAGAIGSSNNVSYFQPAPKGSWRKTLVGRDIGGGEAKSVSRSFSFDIPLTQVSWHGQDPVKLCNNLLSDKVKRGMLRSEVLKQDWKIEAKAFFKFEAVAAKKGKASKDKWGLDNTDRGNKSIYYPVQVRCMKAG